MVSHPQLHQAVDVENGATADPLIEEYARTSVRYYALRFARIAEKGMPGTSFNWAATLGGPAWSAGRGLWANFWMAGILEAVGLILIARVLFTSSPEESALASMNGSLIIGLLLLVGVRIVQGMLADWTYHRRYRRWQVYREGSTGFRIEAALAGGLFAAAAYVLLVYRSSWPEVSPVIVSFPTDSSIAFATAKAIDDMVDWMIVNFAALFDTITAVVRNILRWLELVFVGTPWPLTAAIFLILAYRVGGPRVAIFTAVALAYLGLFGFWSESMSTLALVGASTLICVVLGAPIGIWCAKSRRADILLKPVLDVMQTMPSFVYLVPAIAFFSIGKVPGVLATVVFALPPMVRLTALGIQQVPRHIVEAAVAFGASPRQLLVKIELPLAIPSVMAGINQTIMMSLSMVVIAALIGAGGLGDHIVRALRHLETGTGLLAGIAIVFCAMILDRIVQASSKQRR